MSDMWVTSERVMSDIWVTYEWHVSELWVTCEWQANELWVTYEWHMSDMWASYEWHVSDKRTSYEWHVSDTWVTSERVMSEWWVPNLEISLNTLQRHGTLYLVRVFRVEVVQSDMVSVTVVRDYGDDVYPMTVAHHWENKDPITPHGNLAFCGPLAHSLVIVLVLRLTRSHNLLRDMRVTYVWVTCEWHVSNTWVTCEWHVRPHAPNNYASAFPWSCW